MDPPDDNLSFDFFEDEPPAPSQGLRARIPQRAGRRGGAGVPRPPRQLAPVRRLAVLVFFAFLVIFVFALLVASCAGQSRHDADASYMAAVNTIARESSTDGSHTITALTTQNLTAAQAAQRLTRIAASEQQYLHSAQGLAPPGRLRPENAALLEALELRVLGLDGLASAFTHTIGATSSVPVAALALSLQAERLLASDIVWDDLFLKPAVNQLSRDGVGGVTPPESHFLADPGLLVTPGAMALIVRRIAAAGTGTGTPTGLHGTGLVSVAALTTGTSGKPRLLHTGGLNTVTTSSNLVFRVTIRDDGNFQEVQIPVQLTIGRPQSQGGPITRTATVQLINPGSEATVVFGNIGQVPLSTQTTVAVDVARVPGETNTGDNSAQYNVVFSLLG